MCRFIVNGWNTLSQELERRATTPRFLVKSADGKLTGVVWEQLPVMIVYGLDEKVVGFAHIPDDDTRLSELFGRLEPLGEHGQLRFS